MNVVTHLLNQKQSFGLLTALFETTPLSLSYLDTEFRYVLASHALAQLAGKTPAELLGTTPFDDREGLETWLRPVLQQVLDSGQPYIEQAAALVQTGANPADESEKFWNINYTPVYDENDVPLGILTILEDVTAQVLQRRQLEEAASEATTRAAQLEVHQTELQIAQRLSDETQAALLELAAAATGVINLKQLVNRIVEIVAQVSGCNRVGLSLYQPVSAEYQPTAVYGLETEQVAEWHQTPGVRRDPTSPYDQMFFVQHQPLILDFEQVREAARQQGTEIPNPYGIKNLMMLPLVQSSEVMGILSLDYAGQYHDFSQSETAILTGMARLSAITIQNVRLLAEANEAATLREANRLKDEFMSLVAHELRNPLTTIKGYTQMTQRQLKKAGITSIQTRYLDTIIEQAERMARLVEDLLDLSKIEAGRFELRCKECDLAALTKRTLEFFQTSTATHQLSLTFFPSPDHALFTGWYDSDRLAQVVNNLLSNAIKYSPQGGPIEVRLQRQTLTQISLPTASQPNDSQLEAIHFSVKDQGIGIPLSQQGNLFERFYRALNSQESGLPGLGLGLHISSQIIAQHQGQMWLESAGENQGSTFHFWVPVTNTN